MKQFNVERWRALCSQVGIEGRVDAMFDELLARYAEPHRCYHNAKHVDECLAALDGARSEAVDVVALEFAIWFHDAIYDPHRNDNEEARAALAEDYLRGISLSEDVGKLVLATKNHEAGGMPDAPLLIDIDLSILGAPPEQFAEYDRAIRREYAWVPVKIYRAKRAELLRRFLARPRIFSSEGFYSRLETQARKNLLGAIAALDDGMIE